VMTQTFLFIKSLCSNERTDPGVHYIGMLGAAGT
jgi:hypothetical protein